MGLLTRASLFSISALAASSAFANCGSAVRSRVLTANGIIKIGNTFSSFLKRAAFAPLCWPAICLRLCRMMEQASLTIGRFS